MVLVDTSVWVSHLREGIRELRSLLEETQVLSHEFIVGELACGNLKKRGEILALLQALPGVPVVSQNEFLFFIEYNTLMGAGVGFVDLHLLAAAKLHGVPLWTLDSLLQRIAAKLKLSYK